MKKVGNIIDRVMKDLGLSRRYNEQKSILFWDDIVGLRKSNKQRPLYTRDGKLIVEVENSTWMNELQFLRMEILEKLNKKLGRWTIVDIYFLLKKEHDNL